MPERTLGDMTAHELVESADSEVRGLVEWVEKTFKPNADDLRWLHAYTGSIRGRLAVAEMKVRPPDGD